MHILYFVWYYILLCFLWDCVFVCEMKRQLTVHVLKDRGAEVKEVECYLFALFLVCIIFLFIYFMR